ncbi:MAG TPA: hypothetical protein VF695_08095 [Sphingomonas sp.]|jgi:hypothetical protein
MVELEEIKARIAFLRNVKPPIPSNPFVDQFWHEVNADIRELRASIVAYATLPSVPIEARSMQAAVETGVERRLQALKKRASTLRIGSKEPFQWRNGKEKRSWLMVMAHLDAYEEVLRGVSDQTAAETSEAPATSSPVIHSETAIPLSSDAEPAL